MKRVEIPSDTLTLTAAQCASLMQVGLSNWYRMMWAGLIPDPLPLKGDRRWSRQEIEAWVAAGAPPRGKWNQRKKCDKLK